MMLRVNSKAVNHPNTRQKVGRKQALHSTLLNDLDASASVLLATRRQRKIINRNSYSLQNVSRQVQQY